MNTTHIWRSYPCLPNILTKFLLTEMEYGMHGAAARTTVQIEQSLSNGWIMVKPTVLEGWSLRISCFSGLKNLCDTY